MFRYQLSSGTYEAMQQEERRALAILYALNVVNDLFGIQTLLAYCDQKTHAQSAAITITQELCKKLAQKLLYTLINYSYGLSHIILIMCNHSNDGPFT